MHRAVDLRGVGLAASLAAAGHSFVDDHLLIVELRDIFITVEQSLVNLRTFPWVRAREADGSLALCGTWFDISLGELHALGAHGWERVEAGA